MLPFLFNRNRNGIVPVSHTTGQCIFGTFKNYFAMVTNECQTFRPLEVIPESSVIGTQAWPGLRSFWLPVSGNRDATTMTVKLQRRGKGCLNWLLLGLLWSYLEQILVLLGISPCFAPSSFTHPFYKCKIWLVINGSSLVENCVLIFKNQICYN